MAWLRNLIKEKLGLYDLGDLQAGARCGCCGRWMPEEVIPKYWPWSLCQLCATVGGVNNLPAPSYARDLK